MKLRLLDHFVEDVRRLRYILVRDSSAHKRFDVGNKRAHQELSWSSAIRMLEKVLFVEQKQIGDQLTMFIEVRSSSQSVVHRRSSK